MILQPARGAAALSAELAAWHTLMARRVSETEAPISQTGDGTSSVRGLSPSGRGAQGLCQSACNLPCALPKTKEGLMAVADSMGYRAVSNGTVTEPPALLSKRQLVAGHLSWAADNFDQQNAPPGQLHHVGAALRSQCDQEQAQAGRCGCLLLSLQTCSFWRRLWRMDSASACDTKPQAFTAALSFINPFKVYKRYRWCDLKVPTCVLGQRGPCWRRSTWAYTCCPALACSQLPAALLCSSTVYLMQQQGCNTILALETSGRLIGLPDPEPQAGFACPPAAQTSS